MCEVSPFQLVCKNLECYLRKQARFNDNFDIEGHTFLETKTSIPLSDFNPMILPLGADTNTKLIKYKFLRNDQSVSDGFYPFWKEHGID